MAQGLQLIKTESAIGDTPIDKSEKLRSRVRRLLLWTGVMKTSTFNKDGQLIEKDEWNLGVILAIAVLYLSVFGMLIIMCVGAAMFYLDLREDARTQDAWRQKEYYDRWQLSQKQCSENAERLKGLITYNQQKKQETPPQFLDIKECGKQETNERNH